MKSSNLNAKTKNVETMPSMKPEELKKEVSMMDKDFVIEEYKNKWEYIRHMEESRQKFVRWYVLIVGGLLAFLFRDITSLSAVYRIVILCFLALYSGFANLYLLVHKRNYKLYTDRIRQIEEDFCNFKLERSVTRKLESVFGSVFLIYYNMVVLIGTGIVFLLFYGACASILWGGLAAAVYFGWNTLWNTFGVFVKLK